MISLFSEKSQNGFVAIVSAIIISMILMSLTVGLGLSSFLNRLNVLDSESKAQSYALASACVNVALLNLAKDFLYSPVLEAVFVNDNQCKIISIESLEDKKIIKTQGIVNSAYTNLIITANAQNLNITDWQEY